uniref:AMP-dependent synthetase/ligase domain-containing protein n=2 Tax=Pseudo-nitzschia australis TaxID=44445 RepID=A0A6V0C542_9STRA
MSFRIFGTKILKAKDTNNISNGLVSSARAAAGSGASASSVWHILQNQLSPSQPFDVHQKCYDEVYKGIDDVKPAWIPSKEVSENTNIFKMMTEKAFSKYEHFYQWSVGSKSRDEFWMKSMEKIKIHWETAPSSAFDMTDGGAAHVNYFPEGRLNISDSCFNKRDPLKPALIYGMESDSRNLREMSFKTLDYLSNQIANGITHKLRLKPGDAVGICMPMTPESVAIYLGIVKAGCVVISIADSFSSDEIATRCRLSNAKTIFTQDVIFRGAKFLPLFQRVLEADKFVQKSEKGDSQSMKIVVLPGMLHAKSYPNKSKDANGSTWTDRDDEGHQVALHDSILTTMRKDHDISWYDLLHLCSEEYTSVKRSAMEPCNILFSSGTTGEPKAILWSHSTPIKSAVDGYYHQDIKIGDRVAWPTNIGWMMGPWLLFQLINGATIGLFNGIPSTKSYCEFVDEAKISMLGVVPSLVKSWQASNATENCDWSKIRTFSSTGEASDPVAALWLMSRVPGYAPVMEYCGGTEIGGSFLSSTLIQENVPAMFSTPVLGSKFLLQDAEDKPVKGSSFDTDIDGSDSGELVLIPPSIGMSTSLLNRDHYTEYYEGMPSGPDGEVLRRHGDEVEFVRSSAHLSSENKNSAIPYFRALGRSDDTMNIGGIKVGSVEIENVCNLVDNVLETAAIAVSGTKGGPSKLVIYVVLKNDVDPKEAGFNGESLKAAMQRSIKTKLNPLFGISSVVITDSLPRTASNKVMRRLLRDEYAARA